jgi:hypothetical protein
MLLPCQAIARLREEDGGLYDGWVAGTGDALREVAFEEVLSSDALTDRSDVARLSSLVRALLRRTRLCPGSVLAHACTTTASQQRTPFRSSACSSLVHYCRCLAHLPILRTHTHSI